MKNTDKPKEQLVKELAQARQRIAELENSKSERKQTENAIKNRLAFEKVISTTSSRFVGAFDVDNAINAALGDMGRLSHASRAYIFIFSKDTSTMSNTNEWCAKGVSAEIDTLQDIPADTFPWWMKRLREGKDIHIADVSKMPKEARAEREILERQAIKSLLVLPLYIGEELAGFMGLDNITQFGQWGDYDMRFLRISSEIIGNAIERKRSEDALRESEQRFRSVVENSHDGILIADNAYRFIYVNNELCRILDYPYEEIIGHDFREFLDEEAEKIVGDRYIQRQKGEFLPPRYEFNIVRKGGEKRRVEISSTIIKDLAGNVQTVAQILDITERKRAEETLRVSEEKYRTIIETMEEGYSEVDLRGDMIFFNDSLCRMSGYTRDEFLGMNYKEYTSEETARKLYQTFNEVYRTGRPARMVDYEVIRKDGSIDILEQNVSSINDSNGQPIGFRCVVRDVTERKNIEAQLQQAQKLEAIGTLASGIAHDFNNLLMGIQGNASLMLLDCDPTHPHHKRLKTIEQSVQSGAGLTMQLLGFARGGKYEVRPTDINDLIKGSSDMFARTKKEIHVLSKYQEGIWTVDADQTQIEQVLLNLYVNAWQAMPGGGEIYIETENVILDGDYVKTYKTAPGRYVKMSITDTGVGMDEATRQKIFEPFFTTKGMGRGTGLGLASAYGIIKNHKGIINVYSEEGVGTTFNIYLPASDKAVIGEKVKDKEVLRGEETVLLIDDEEMIIDIGKEMLENMGYKVLTAKDGKKAIDAYKNNQDKIDAVVLDMIMPEMGGGEIYDRLRKINPEIKVLLSSGYSINGKAKAILKRGCNGFIQKPFNMKGLSRKIREVLDKK
ncbi:MAG: PAS domain S-box protein [Thermodesulfobacteriota bacterium]|nr:PAS domain S-box protein [Thermodesulfobacteriota bacterium]